MSPSVVPTVVLRILETPVVVVCFLLNSRHEVVAHQFPYAPSRKMPEAVTIDGRQTPDSSTPGENKPLMVSF